jgi:limonene-1,2-epoxide hydrolase
VTETNLELASRFWETLNRRDFDAVGAMMSERGHYIDVPVIDVEDGAFGPAETAARLRLGLEPLENYILHEGTMVASDNLVITEHNEEWFWGTGETVLLRFCSVMEINDGKVDRWWDYFDLGAIMNAAPAWWIEHIMVGYK